MLIIFLFEGRFNLENAQYGETSWDKITLKTCISKSLKGKCFVGKV